jgi:hypothetical protein
MFYLAGIAENKCSLASVQAATIYVTPSGAYLRDTNHVYNTGGFYQTGKTGTGGAGDTFQGGICVGFGTGGTGGGGHR